MHLILCKEEKVQLLARRIGCLAGAGRNEFISLSRTIIIKPALSVVRANLSNAKEGSQMHLIHSQPFNKKGCIRDARRDSEAKMFQTLLGFFP